MENPGIHTRSRLPVTAAALALLSLLALALILTRAGDAHASSTVAGGTAPPTTAPTSSSGGANAKSGAQTGTGKGATGGTATGKPKSGGARTKPAAHKTTITTAIKIAGAHCVPVTIAAPSSTKLRCTATC